LPIPVREPRESQEESGRLDRHLESALRASSADEWEMILNRLIPAGRVLTVAEALQNQQIKYSSF
jgi:crotonobetainyl-CoA:carnitine CoA-transferase CaiB-like acyl-CoA transferase